MGSFFNFDLVKSFAKTSNYQAHRVTMVEEDMAFQLPHTIQLNFASNSFCIG